MADRFDLENSIMQSTSVADDLDLLAEAAVEEVIEHDELVNALIGLSVLARARAWKTFETFKAVFKLDEYRDTKDDDE